MTHSLPSCLLLLLALETPGLAAGDPKVAPPHFDAQGRVIGAPLSERIANYEIDARLDPSKQQLTGRETITWTNRSALPQATLWFHLYWNAFKNDRSTFYQDARRMGGFRDETASGPDYPKRKKEDWGWSDVKSLKVKGGAELLGSLRFEHPDDDNAEDRTVFTVTLPQAVPPGGEVTLEVEWDARVPKIVSRAGHDTRGFFLMGQWFPKLGVLEIPTQRGATAPRWNCHQYHSSSEFYADFGTYDVSMTTPRAMKLGATGVQVSRVENADGTATTRFHQDDVIDFAWTASEQFEMQEDVLRVPGLPEVKLTALFYPRYRRSGPQLLAALKASLEHQGRWWFPFPYPHVTVVAPPSSAHGSEGMEYPTFIASTGREEPGEPKDAIIWLTTAHEIGHNYWQSMIATNEFEEAWLDEGVNSYGTYKVTMAEDVRIRTSQLLPSPLRQLFGNLVDTNFTERDRMRAIARPQWSSPLTTVSWKHRDRGDYGSNSYDRTQLTLFALEQRVGEETMARIMRTYAERWRFRHPSAEDFLAVANEVAGEDVGGLWNDLFRGTGGLDYSVTKLSCAAHPPDEKIGAFDDGPGGRTLLERSEREGKNKGTAAEHQRCELQVEREGELRTPVEIEVTFEDGTHRTETWDGQSRWRQFVYEGDEEKAQVKQVEVAPRGLLALDATPYNNSRTRSASGHVATALFGWVTYVGQLVNTLPSAFW